MSNQTYSNILRRSALKWDVKVPDGLLDDADIPRANIVETFAWQSSQSNWRNARIDLVSLNNLWSYTIHFSDTNRGTGFAPYLKFCDPVPTREDALALAIASILKNKPYLSPDLLTWLDSLCPQQLSLFDPDTSIER